MRSGRSTGTLWGVGAATAALLLTACTGDDPKPGSPPVLPADRVVFGLGSTGHGWMSHTAQQLHSPTLTIHGDGRVVFVDTGTVTGPGTSMAPPEYRVARVDPVDVSAFAHDLEQQNLVDLGTDVGIPGVTDQATTTVTLHAYGEPADLRVYAFAPRFEEGLSADALTNRAALRAAIEDAWEFTRGHSEPYVPQTVAVFQLPGADAPADDVPEWPGPDPQSFLTEGVGGAAGEITGESAAVVYAAARGNPHAYWSVGDAVMRLVVDPVP